MPYATIPLLTRIGLFYADFRRLTLSIWYIFPTYPIEVPFGIQVYQEVRYYMEPYGTVQFPMVENPTLWYDTVEPQKGAVK